MKRTEYKSLIRDIGDPYSVWIRDKEIKREEREFKLPDDYTLFLNGDGDIDGALSMAADEYGAFKKGYDFIYADEDEIEKNGRRHSPFFKPDFSPDTLDSFYYPGGFTIVKNSLISETERESPVKNGSLEFLRECGRRAKKPLHIPEILYHAASHHAYGYRNGENTGPEINCPSSIAVVILSKDHPELLKQCLSGLYKAAAKESVAIECVVIDNGSSEENTSRYEELSGEFAFSYIREETDFVYSHLCNKGAGETKAEILLFLNDDIEVPENTRFLTKMMKEAMRSSTGAVGCKLLYPGGDRIQHCGISLLKSGASHCFSGYSDGVEYGRGINRIKRNVYAVTGACLMVERRKYLEAGGFDEELSVAYTDVDLCASLLKKGYYNVCLNGFYLIHHESFSRKSDSEEQKRFARLKAEREYFYEKNRDLIINGDPWYNRNLTETELDMGVNIPSLQDKVPFYHTEEAKKTVFPDDRFKKAGEGQFLFNLETCEKRTSDAQGHEDFLEISGWGFAHGKAGYEFDIYVLVRDTDRDHLLRTGRISRSDLPSVFPKEKDILLSGFSVKAEDGFFNKTPEKDDISLVFMTRDIFGKQKGYIV